MSQPLRGCTKVIGKGLVKKYRGVGPEQRGGGSSVFEPLVKGWVMQFLATRMGWVILFLLWELTHI